MFQITLTQGNPPVPIDLTGLTVTAMARTKSTDFDSVSAIIDVTDETGGVLLMRWPGAAVRDWLANTPKKTGVWDLQVSDGTNDPLTLCAGSFSAEMDVTR